MASALGVGALGCHGSPAVAPKWVPAANLREVRDDELAVAYAEWVMRGATGARDAIATPIAERLLARAKSQLEGGRERTALVLVRQALSVLRLAHVPPQRLSDAAVSTLAAAVEVVSRTGDEGAASGLYSLWSAARPEDARPRGHLEAIGDWLRDGDRAVRGDLSRKQRELYRASDALPFELDPSRFAAVDRLGADWVGRLQQIRRLDRGGGPVDPERAEALDYYARSTAVRLLTHHLRDGDLAAGAALTERPELGPEINGPLRVAISDANASHGGEACAMVLRELSPAARLDGLADAVSDAATGVAFACLPHNAHDAAIAEVAARGELAAGLGDAAVALLARALLGTEDDPRRPAATELGTALTVSANAIREDETREDYASARRAFAAAAPLVSAADDVGAVTPSASAVRALMAQIEGEAGDPTASERLVALALEHEPSAAAHAQRARLARARGDLDGARQAVRSALALDRPTEPLPMAIHRALEGDLARLAGDASQARASYEAALGLLLPLRASLTGPASADVGARIAAIHRHFAGGELLEDAASTMAESAASGAPGLTGRLVLGRFARALARLDPKAAKAAFHRALELGVPADERVIGAALARAVSVRAGASVDPTITQEIESISTRDDEAGRLARVALGKEDPAAAMSKARNARRAQQIELVLAAMAWAARAPDAQAKLLAIAHGKVIGSTAALLAEAMAMPERAFLDGSPKTGAP